MKEKVTIKERVVVKEPAQEESLTSVLLDFSLADAKEQLKLIETQIKVTMVLNSLMKPKRRPHLAQECMCCLAPRTACTQSTSASARTSHPTWKSAAAGASCKFPGYHNVLQPACHAHVMYWLHAAWATSSWPH